MKSKLVLLIIPIMFFACEEETDEGPAVLSAPENFSGTVSQNNISLTWSAVTDASSYLLARDGAEIYNGSGLSYDDNDLEYGTSYNYTILSINSSGENGAVSSPLEITTEYEITLVGSWTASISEYNSPDCSADSLEISGTGTATYTETTLMAEYTFSIGTFEDFCTQMGGTIDGDSCTVSAYGYSMSIDESYFADSLCIPEGGTINSDGACEMTAMVMLDYTIDGTDYCETTDAGTDSSETDCGTIDLSATSATITFSDDSTCTVIELSK